jgi:hypothetical protein
MLDPGWLPEEEDEMKRYITFVILILVTIYLVVR